MMVRQYIPVLTRIYGSEELSMHNYSKTYTSVTFAGTVFGMLTFGEQSQASGGG